MRYDAVRSTTRRGAPVTVSVAMIVKTEERTLARCLDSIRGAVDEIVIVDTGSVDATVEIARRYTDRIFEFPWIDDFAAARQFAFDQATGDWVAWLDADDVVLHADRIRPLADTAPADVAGFYWRYVLGRDARRRSDLRILARALRPQQRRLPLGGTRP